MTERTSWIGNAWRSLRNCTVAIAAILAILAVPAAQATPPLDPIYDLVWEPAPSAEAPAGSFVGINPAQSMKAFFPATGLRLQQFGDVAPGNPGWEFGLAWSAYGYAGALQPVGPATVQALGNRATLNREGAPTEWYLNTPSGFEQWFSIDAAPAGPGGNVVIELALSGGMVAESASEGTGISLRPANRDITLQYNLWTVTGAAGNIVPAMMAIITDAQGNATGIRVVISPQLTDYPVAVGLAAGHPKFLAEGMGGREIIPGVGSPAGPLFVSANDECSGSQAIPGAGPFPYLTTTVNIGANTDTGDPATTCGLGGNAAQGAAWWVFNPTVTDFYTFNDCPSLAPGTTHDDTIIQIFTSSDSTCAGVMTGVPQGTACSDDAGTCPGVPFLSSALALLNAGTNYYILVWNWAAPPPSADVQIHVRKGLPPPANDTCVAPTPLPLNRTVFGTLLGSDNNYSLSDASCYTGVAQNPLGFCNASGGDVVYEFTPPADGLYSIRARVRSGTGNLALYTTTTCPAGFGPIACPGGAVAANRNVTTANFESREDVSCQFMTANVPVYAIVDQCLPVTGGNFTIEAMPCFPETEPNDTTGTANAGPYAGVSPVIGSVDPAADVDFFSLGTPPAGSRVFAWVETNSLTNVAVPPNPVGTNSGDLDLRVTTGTDTLEYDEQDVDNEHGRLSGAIAGRRLTGVPAYLRINHRTGLQAAEPYHLYSTVQPPGFDAYGSSASPESNEGINDDFPGAEAAGNYFFAASSFNTTDIDFFEICASVGDLIAMQVDNDPTRTDVIPGRTLLTGFSAVTGGQLGPYSTINNPGSQVSNTTSGAGSLTATTPFSPSEAFSWRAEYSGPHYGYVDMRAFPVAVNGADYFFSATINGQNGSEQSADIQLTKTGPATAPAGGTIVYDITLTNNGPSIGLNTSFFDQLPADSAFMGFDLDGAGDLFGGCNAPPIGDVGGSVDCNFDCLPPGRTVTVQIAVQVNDYLACADGYVLTNTIFANTMTNMTPESVTFVQWDTTVMGCTDRDACTTGDACDSGSGTCVPAGPTNCDDGNSCTNDLCNSANGCYYTPNTGNSCEDGDACTTGDTCASGSCAPGGPTVCNDSNACTVDTCDSGSGCVYTDNSAACDDGNCCTIDSCEPASGCVYAPNTAAPVFTNQPSLGVCAALWPPQHGYVDFTVGNTGAAATSQCGIASIEFASCASSQHENTNGVGDGNSTRDCVYEPGALHLRAERDGACSPKGRVYTSSVVATDVCGNSTASSSFDVGVWHDRGHAPTGMNTYSANPGSNQNDTRAGMNGSYGVGCGPGTCNEAGQSSDMSDFDPEMEIFQEASLDVNNLTLARSSGNNVKLTWTNPSIGQVTRFHVYRLDTVTRTWTKIGEVSKLTTTFDDPVLNDGVHHMYKVSAVVK